MSNRPIVDAHMHFWDITNEEKAGHSAKILGAAGARYPKFNPKTYLSCMSDAGVTVKKAIWVECISSTPLKEAQWVAKKVHRNSIKHIPFGIVPYANLTSTDCDDLLLQYSKIPEVKGIRQILNHHPTNANLTWPNVTEDFLKNETWKKNFGKLAQYNFSFDMQLNPHQIEDAVDLIKKHPNITIIINHIATLHLPEDNLERSAAIELWKTGISKLAALPNVYIKISMLGFTAPDWPTNPTVKDAVRHVITHFTTSRCMVVSNFPTDIANASPKEVFDGLDTLLYSLGISEENRLDLYVKTAERAYKL